MNQVHDSIYAKSNFLDVFWTLTVEEFEQDQDGESNNNAFLELQNPVTISREFLDKTQYTEDNVSAYEWIFGKDFISPGRLLLKY